MSYYRSNIFGTSSYITPVVKSLLISNVVVYFLANFLDNFTIGDFLFSDFLRKFLFLYPFETKDFGIWQVFTYMFMHGGIWHLLFNMFALWMFGSELENLMGSSKFLFYYTICGVGAGIANLFIAPIFASVGPTVGASGAIYGVLVAFGLLFPDRIVFMYFIPLPAKIFVGIYMAIELYSGITGTNDGIAHFAHLGGAAVGFIFLIFDKESSSGQNLFQYIFGNVKRKKHDNGFSYTIENETSHRRYDDDYKYRANQEVINKILDKISKTGYSSLTEEEKKVLYEESKKIR